MAEDTSLNDNDDLAKLFRESGDIGAQSSLWIRPMRQLLDSGKSIGQLTFLAFRGQDTGAYPFGVLTHTKKQRVVFWPVLPLDADMIAAEGKVGVADHITLELANRKTHVTAYDVHGQASHFRAVDFGHKQAWRLHENKGSGLALWFTMLVRWSVLLDQETAVQRCTEAPTPAEAERRKELFASIAARMKVIDVPLPKSVTSPEYVYCAVYVVTDADGEVTFSDGLFPSGHVDTAVDGWPDGSELEIQPMRLRYEHAQYVVATSCPPGRAQQDVMIGLHRRKPNAGT